MCNTYTMTISKVRPRFSRHLQIFLTLFHRMHHTRLLEDIMQYRIISIAKFPDIF